MDDRRMLDFLGTAEKLKCITRHCVTSTGRPESVAEHSWRLCLMALLLRGDFPGVNMARVLELCVVHDLGEAVTGDIPVFRKNGRDEDVERLATEGLAEMPGGEASALLRGLFEEMWAMQTPEAKLFKALDKLEAVIAHNESPIESWLPFEYELNLSYGREEAGEFPALHSLREQVRQDTLDKIEGAGHED